MATTVARLEAVLSAQTRDFDQAMDRSHKKTHAFSKVAGAAFLGVGAAAVGMGAMFAKIGWDEFTQGAQVAAQTEAVLKSTGGAANVTAKQIDGLAKSIMNKSGIDDEAVKSGENMLLTFTNVRNETGKGNDIFNQSTSILADMSTALGTDMPKQAIQLGKALNDPIKGVSALSRVGVTFTAGQKEQIKAMVESGNTMGAQKLILGELNKEFGGSAEAAGKTLPGQLKILREQFSNVAGDVMAKVVPALLAVTGWIQDHGPEIKRVISEVVGAVKVTFTTVLIPATVMVIEAFRLLVDWTKRHWDQISAVVMGVVSTIKTVITDATATIQFIWRHWGEEITNIVRTAFSVVLTVVTTVLGNIRDVFQLISDIIHGRWGDAWGEIKSIVSRTLKAIWDLLRDSLDIAGNVAKALGEALWLGIKQPLSAVGEFFRDLPGRIWAAIRENFGSNLVEPLKEAFNAITGWFRDNWKDVLVALLGGVPGALWVAFHSKFGDEFLDKIKAEFRVVVDWVKENIVDKIVEFFADLPGRVAKAAKGLGSGIVNALNPFGGDPNDPNMKLPSAPSSGAVAAITGGDSTIDRSLWDDLASARSFGLTLTSGYRPGAITANGTPSDHGRFPSHAIDVSNGVNTPQEAAFFRSLIGDRSIKQAFFDPLGSIFGGVLSSYREGGHSDHVHVATYDQGGFLRPGWNLAYNGLGRPEPVGMGSTNVIVNVPGLVGEKDALARRIAELLTDHQRRGGQLGFTT